MGPKPTLASQLFADIKAAPDRAAFLRNLVDARTAETDWLDFKCKPLKDNTKEKYLKEIWYEALSGFANSEGGVLIWGIEASKADGVDAANAVCLIDNPAAFASRLRELHRQGTDPPIQGVEVVAVEDGEEPGKGFVVCLVPESPFLPHRAEIPDKPQYFIRAGDAFRIAGPSMLRRLFHPRAQPRFGVNAFLMCGSDANLRQDRCAMACCITVHNAGTATAQEALVHLRTTLPNNPRAEEFEAHWSPVQPQRIDIHFEESQFIKGYTVQGKVETHFV
jgi:hypothetical protein